MRQVLAPEVSGTLERCVRRCWMVGWDRRPLAWHAASLPLATAPRSPRIANCLAQVSHVTKVKQ